MINIKIAISTFFRFSIALSSSAWWLSIIPQYIIPYLEIHEETCCYKIPTFGDNQYCMIGARWSLNRIQVWERDIETWKSKLTGLQSDDEYFRLPSYGYPRIRSEVGLPALLIVRSWVYTSLVWWVYYIRHTSSVVMVLRSLSLRTTMCAVLRGVGALWYVSTLWSCMQNVVGE